MPSQLLLVILYARPAPPVASDHRPGIEDLEPPAFPLVADRAGGAAIAREQRDDGEFHVDVETAMDALVLERPNQLETGTIADVRQPGIPVAAEIALQDLPVSRPIEDRAPGLELADAVRRFLRVQLRHPPVVDVLSAAHGVGEVDFPAVAVVDIGQRRRDTPFGHDGVRLAEQRLAQQPHLRACGRRLDCGAQSGAAGADDEDVILVSFVVHHARYLSLSLLTEAAG